MLVLVKAMPFGRPCTGRERYVCIKLCTVTHTSWVETKNSLSLKSDVSHVALWQTLQYSGETIDEEVTFTVQQWCVIKSQLGVILITTMVQHRGNTQLFSHDIEIMYIQ